MREKQAITEQIRKRYKKASKKEKKYILNELVQTTGDNRKYEIRILRKTSTKQVLTFVNGKSTRIRSNKCLRPKNRQGKRIYTDDIIKSLRKILAFYWYKCGKYLAIIIREQMPYIQVHKKPNFK